MCNILDYVRTYGNQTFKERHFSSVDALVLAQLSYMDWDSAVPKIKDNGAFVRLQDTLYLGELEPMIQRSVFKKGNRDLFIQMANSKRFGDVKLNFYTQISNEERNLQLSAITFLLPCGWACVTYRGTDESLNGWRENFSMVYRYPVPAQEYATVYLQQVAEYLSCPLIVCGHSKGGNLAVYAAAKCGEKIQKRIRRVYNFDGPGFRDEFIKDAGFQSIERRVRKYVAPESIVGLLLKDSTDTFMVESRSHGMRQHDPYQWELFGGRMRKACHYNKERRKAGERLNQKILKVSPLRAGEVIESFFGAAKDSGLERLTEMDADYAICVLKNFHKNGMYDRDSVLVLTHLLLFMMPGRKILQGE